jgi:hypothetical protein
VDTNTRRYLMDLFKKSNKCDFCDTKNRTIIRAFVHPVFQHEGGAMVLKDVIMAKKCMGCIEEESA